MIFMRKEKTKRTYYQDAFFDAHKEVLPNSVEQRLISVRDYTNKIQVINL